ncbi:MAG: glycine cleavage system protein GcvH [Bacteroidetes bacterium]|nr:glycine cleavage system protein GcvH [Bacteroidota bacterium]MCL5026081.1 glycine cleavage system protein GcvH [Chloroflexota bacterium]
MQFPPELKYSKEHEWARIQSNRAVIGITDYAQDQLGDVVFAELPEVGAEVAQFGRFGTIESVKAASDLFSPLSGVVKAVNKKLEDHPELVNQDPYGEGWMLEIELADPGQADKLLDAEHYQHTLPSE